MKWNMLFTSRFPGQGVLHKYQMNLSQALVCTAPVGYAIYFFQTQEPRKSFHFFMDLFILLDLDLSLKSHSVSFLSAPQSGSQSWEHLSTLYLPTEPDSCAKRAFKQM